MKLILPILLFSICVHAQEVKEILTLKDSTRVIVVSDLSPTLIQLQPNEKKTTFHPAGLVWRYFWVVVPENLTGYDIEFMATPRAVTPLPPPVIVNIDDRDPAIKYTGNWDQTCNTCVDNFNNTISFSNATGNSFEYTFTGKAISWIGERVFNHGIAGVKIDSQPEEIFDLYSATPKKKEVIFKKGWTTSGTHKVVIRVTGTKNTASSGFYVVNDQFIVEK